MYINNMIINIINNLKTLDLFFSDRDIYFYISLNRP
jgi:hypothetical protein